MKAMILSAGRGTRLGSLSQNCPKALVEVQGIPLLAGVISRLAQHGFREIIINVHHLASQVVEFLNHFRERPGCAGLSLSISMEEQLLDTGGGVQKVNWFFDDGKPFLVHNVDVLTDLNLSRLMEFHLDSEALATLAVRERESRRYFLFDVLGSLCGWQALQSKETRMVRLVQGPVTSLSFMGIQIISPVLLQLLKASPPFSLVDAYLELVRDGQLIKAFRGDKARWIDLGRKEDLDQAAELFEPSFFAGLRSGL